MEKKAREHRIDDQIVESLYRQAPLDIFASVFSAGLLVYFLWPVTPQNILLRWLAVLLLVSAVRTVEVIIYFRRPASVRESSQWGFAFVAGLLASGLVWGSSTLFLFPGQSMPYQAVMSIVLTGMIAGTLITSSQMFPAYAAFSIPVLVPLIVRFLMIPDRVHTLLAIAVLVFLSFTLFGARRNSRSDRERVELKEHFADMLQDQTAELNQSNEYLRAEIEERKKAETALAASEKRYRNLFNNSMDYLYVHDLEGNVEELSRTWQSLGFSEEELKGLNARDLIAEGTRDKFQDYIRFLEKDGWAEGRTQVVSRDGHEIILEYRSEVVLDKENNHPMVRGTGRDVTERILAQREKRELQAHLMRAQRLEAIGTLAGGIAHNFNNILMGIQGNASLGRLENSAPNPLDERLAKIEDLVDRGAQLTAQLLAYAREGRVQVRRIDLNRLIKETAATFGETRKDLRIRLDLGEDLHGVDGDSGQIKQALMNLFVNGADAMPGGGALTVGTRNVGASEIRGGKASPGVSQYVKLFVQDAGTGMDKKTLAKVFDPFFTTKSVGQGTGLGLASVYGIVKTHGGNIHVDSELGCGTSFEIYLPAAGAVDSTVERVKMSANGEERKMVLLVDDEQMILDVGKEMLVKLGYEVLTADNGGHAIETYEMRKRDIALVILDMVMPDMGGGLTFDRLKDIDPDVRVLLSSGYSIDGEASEILDRGCRGFIQKPFRLDDLSGKLDEILGVADS